MARSTKRYSQFKFISGNRKVHQAHLKNLVQSISHHNLLRFNPIIVNRDMEVIDGQHRLMAAISLNVPVWYEVARTSGMDDVRLMNATVRKWLSEDYLNSYAEKGVDSYVNLRKLCQDFDLPVTSALFLIKREDKIRRSTYTVFKLGKFECTEEELDTARGIIMKIERLKEFMVPNLWRSREFIKAFFLVLEKVSFDRLLEKLQQRGLRLERQYSVKKYLQQFEDVLNYRNSSRVTLY